MYFLLLVFILQAPKPQAPITTPETQSVPKTIVTKPPLIEHERSVTTPALTPETALHLQMERDIGGQGVELGVLKEKLSNLDDKREKIDRPDIESLKTSRLYAGWVISFVVLGFGAIAYFRSFLWRSALPLLREELRGNRHPPTVESLDLKEL